MSSLMLQTITSRYDDCWGYKCSLLFYNCSVSPSRASHVSPRSPLSLFFGSFFPAFITYRAAIKINLQFIYIFFRAKDLLKYEMWHKILCNFFIRIIHLIRQCITKWNEVNKDRICQLLNPELISESLFCTCKVKTVEYSYKFKR